MKRILLSIAFLVMATSAVAQVKDTLALQADTLDQLFVVAKSRAQLLKESTFAANAFNIKPIVSSVHNINNVLGKTTGIR